MYTGAIVLLYEYCHSDTYIYIAYIDIYWIKHSHLVLYSIEYFYVNNII